MMVMCTAMESVVIPRPPPIGALLKGNINDTKRSSSSGFRLLENQDDTGSVYSVYKQKIDAMFESDSSSTKNSVQARIEKMFTDVAIDSGIPVNDYGCHSFSVDYLGSVPLNEKVTSLAGLQTPLKDLYFAYKRITRQKKQLTGRLEISAAGLKVQYQGEKGDLEQLNPFPTIAVWSAVKFVLQDDPKSSYAFLPLITDPDNIDKQQLFRSLEGSEKKYISAEYHSPLFAVVMRKIGVHKQLECHGFVCQTSEDAIVVAATLYKSLMSHMKAKEKKPKNRNGVTCMSVASSAFNENSVPVRPPRKKRSSASSIVSDIETIDTESAPLLNEPSKLSKKSVKTRRAPKAPDKQEEDLDAILPYEEAKNSDDEITPKPKVHMGDNWNTFKNNHQKQITAEIKQMMSESSNMGLKRVKSLRRRSEDLTNSDNSGDILTKVTIPRSGSFLNAGGLTRYKSKMQRQNGLATGGSPLGFNELFNEFRLQEGLHSLDEILGVIIDPEGMSFNDLKPIYKEFLLKLSVTLTKDELYQRSKYIMRRHKKKLLRRKSAAQAKKHNVVVSGKLKKLKHVFKKPKEGGHEKVQVETKVAESTISSSSYDARQFAPRESTKKPAYKKRDSSKRRDGQSTSEESDFFSLRKGRSSRNISHHRNSSSGYVSCSECSFDSDTCTCVSADKCYCSLGHKNFNKNKNHKHKCGDLDNCDSLTYCGCDTDSCADSNKCYCTLGGTTKSTIFEQLKHRGFFPSAESAITPPSARKLCKKYSNSKSTKSLEYMPNPAEIYYEKVSKRRAGAKMPINYGSCGFNNGTHFTNRSAIYLKSIHEADHFCRDSISSKFNEKRPFGLKGTSMPPCSEALAVKKSAEIAALFADIKLTQTTDVSHIKPRSFDSTKSRFPSTRMISNSLYSSKSKADMYSAKNGLYTIQSQSDDSSRGARKTPKPDYLTSDNDYSKKVAGTNLENSLGYLP